MNLTDPNDDDITRLAEQWVFVDQTVHERYGRSLDESLDDLGLIQQLLDDQVFSAQDTWQLQSLGIALGRVLANNNEGLDWAIIDDEYGRDPTIRYRDTTLVFNVLTTISKRVEDDEDVDVQFIFDELLKNLEELKDKVG